jgi:hypothetical protein
VKPGAAAIAGLSLLGSVCAPTVASGDLLIYEGFAYERRQGHAGAEISGEGIEGLNGGVGFASPWTTSGNYNSGIPEGEGDYGSGSTYGNGLGARSGPLAYTDIFGNRLHTTGNQVRTSFGFQSWEERDLAQPIGHPGSTAWISFLAQAHGRAGSSRYAFVELSNAGQSWLRLGNVNPVSSGNWGVEVHASASSVRYFDAGTAYPMDIPTMFLARMHFPSGPTGAIRLSVWLNPGNLRHENALLAPLCEFDLPSTTFNRLSVAGRYSTDFDEIRIGGSFEAVTPTQPAPIAIVRLKGDMSAEQVKLTWPAVGAEGFVLQSSTNLEHWAELPVLTAIENGIARASVPVSGHAGFFRLHHVPPAVPSPRRETLEAVGWEPQEIRPGLVYYERHLTNLFGSPQVVNVLALDLDHPRFRLELTAMDVWGLTRMPVPQLAEHARAVAAINGGFGPARVYPEVGYGMMKFRGVVWPFVNDPAFNDAYEALGRNAVGIDSDGEWHFASRGFEGWEIGARWPADWPGMIDVMAGGSHLVRAGKVHPLVILSTTRGAYLSESGLYNRTFDRNPRTALGITYDRVAVLVTVAGRFPGIAAGMTLHEMADLLLFMGCRDALEMDGGGSSTMWIGQQPFSGVVNYPTDNGLFDHEGTRSLRLAVLIMERKP